MILMKRAGYTSSLVFVLEWVVAKLFREGEKINCSHRRAPAAGG
jgi:hypothetical protein